MGRPLEGGVESGLPPGGSVGAGKLGPAGGADGAVGASVFAGGAACDGWGGAGPLSVV